MIKAYKYKIKPTRVQQEKLSQFFGCARFVYNWGLNKKMTMYKETKKNVTYLELSRELTNLKKQEETKWLADCNAVVLQQSLRHLDNAYTRFFKAKKGFPKFKSKKYSRDAISFIANVHFDFDNWKVKIPNIGWINLCKNRDFDQSKVKQGTTTISKDKCGDLWCSVLIDDCQPNKLKAKICEETAVGIDIGIKDYVILSDGTKYGNPKYLEKNQHRLATLQRRLSRKQKGSKNKEKAKIALAKLHRKIANQRDNFCHQLTSRLVKEWDTFCMEDLNVKGMLQNHNLANSIQSCAWTTFRNQMVYKCEMNGKNLIFIGRFEPSSKTCSNCGNINKELKLSDRKWVCPHCGTKHDRDVNAAKNIKDMGLHPQARVGIELKL